VEIAKKRKMNKKEKDKLFEKEFLPQVDALYTFAYHLTYDETYSNDLVQDTYLNAYRFIDKYIEGTNAKAWLFKILKNIFINQYRKKSKEPVKVNFDDLFEKKEWTKTSLSSKDYYLNLMGDEVTLALNALPMDFRTVILLCDLEDFSYEEISKILEIPIGTVRSRLHRARNMLKKMLKNYGSALGYKDKRN